MCVTPGAVFQFLQLMNTLGISRLLRRSLVHRHILLREEVVKNSTLELDADILVSATSLFKKIGY